MSQQRKMEKLIIRLVRKIKKNTKEIVERNNKKKTKTAKLK